MALNPAPTTERAAQASVSRASLAVVEPDAAEWDAFTAQHRHGHLLQSAGWGALKQQVGWSVRRVLIAGPAGALAGAQLLLRSRLGLSVAYVPRGPLFAGEVSADALLLAALDRLARRQRAVFLRLEPNLVEEDARAGAVHRMLLREGFRTAAPLQPHSSLLLDLAPPAEQLFAAMSKGHRADIRRAAREHVVVRRGETAGDLDAFYAIMEQTSRRAAFAIHSRSYYQTAWERFGQLDGAHARLLLAEREGTTLAACLVFAWAGTGLYLYGGSTEEGLKSGANHALQWQALQWVRAQGCASYDFWGVPDQFGQAAATTDADARAQLEEAAKRDPLYGVFRFKKGFGGQVIRFMPAYDRVYLPPLYALWQRRVRG